MASRLFTKTLTIRLALVITTKRAVSSIRPLSSLTIKFGGATIPGVSHAVSTTNNCPTTGDKTPSAAMGRSGYDTSSMKMAARPRPAATKVGSALGGGEKGNGTKKPSSESSDVVGQGTEKASDQPSFAPVIPTGRQAEGKSLDDVPLPSLIGRGWTFWL